MKTKRPTRSTGPLADIAIIGVGKMGAGLALNMTGKRLVLAVFDSNLARTKDLAAQSASIVPVDRVAQAIGHLKRPRRVLITVPVGSPVDEALKELIPLLDPGDIVVDGGNSDFDDTIRRGKIAENKGLLYVGCGVSGGEDGARHGPCLMPGGSAAAWPHLKRIFEAIAARAPDGTPCCRWIGDNGAGHYVKMIHNGIEYGIMQLISEAYLLMKAGLGMTADEMSDLFGEWDKAELKSYLIEITRDVLAKKDTDGSPLLEKVMDTAEQMGTGRSTVASSLKLGVPVPVITGAVEARSLAAMRAQRIETSKFFTRSDPTFSGARSQWTSDIRQALYVSEVITYTQGFMLMLKAAGAYDWNLRLGDIARIWRGGCIIRSAFLGNIAGAYDKNPELPHILLAPFFRRIIATCDPAWRRTVAQAISNGFPTPAFASALAFFDALRRERLSANIIQALRDCFGGHSYERVDQSRGMRFHSHWRTSGSSGGSAAA